jgi:hypothetical protein
VNPPSKNGSIQRCISPPKMITMLRLRCCCQIARVPGAFARPLGCDAGDGTNQMPFIVSHPAAVVPLTRVGPFARWGLSLSALVVGSMVSDLPHYIHLTRFIHLPSGKHFAHTFAGVFLFCIPVGMFVLWVFHIVLKPPLLSLLPVNQQERLAPIATKFRFGPLRQFFLIILSLVLGALTHLVWDSFTHVHGWPVQHFSILHMPVMQTSRQTLFVYNFLQRGSSLAGIALLIYWCFKWLRQGREWSVRLPVQGETHLVLCMAVAALILAGIYSYWKSPVLPQLSRHQPFVRRMAVTEIAVASVEMLVFSLCWHWRASESLLWMKPNPSPIHSSASD